MMVGGWVIEWMELGEWVSEWVSVCEWVRVGGVSEYVSK